MPCLYYGFLYSFYLSIRVSDTVHISFVSEIYMNDDACIYTNRYRLPPICPNWTSHIVIATSLWTSHITKAQPPLDVHFESNISPIGELFRGIIFASESDMGLIVILLLTFFPAVAQTIAKVPFTPGHETVGEVSKSNM